MERDKVRRLVWGGLLPVKFYTVNMEGTANQCFLLVRRCSYFPLLTPTVRKHLHPPQFTGTDMDIWYSFEGIPLKWHYPMGLIYDLLWFHSRRHSQPKNFDSTNRPWEIRVHFEDPYPADRIIKMPSYDAPQEMFMSLIKQADYIRCGGSARSVMAMSKADQNRLWDAICTGNFERYWQSNSKLHSLSDSFWIGDYDPNCCFNLPIKIYLLATAGDPLDTLPAPIQRLIPSRLVEEGNRLSTVADLIGRFRLSEAALIHSNNMQAISTVPTPLSGVETPIGTPPASTTMYMEPTPTIDVDLSQQFKFHLHGISVPSSAELLILADTMSAPDNFLHFVVLQEC